MELRDLIAAAAPFHERLADGYIPSLAVGHEAVCQKLAAKWAGYLSKIEPDILDRRLALEGIESARARSLLGDVYLPEEASLPPWGAIFQAVLGEADKIALQDWAHPIEEGAKPEPEMKWRDFFEPFVRVGRQKLSEHLSGSAFPLSKTVKRELETALVYRLHFIAHAALDLDFAVWQATAAPAAPEPGGFARSRYHDHVFFSNYPAAARQLSLVTEYWVEAMAELWKRLETDVAEIRRVFFPRGDISPLPPIASVSAALSDPHRRGRGVVILKFIDDTQIVYKPRSVGLEAAYFDLVSWLNHCAEAIPSSCVMKMVDVLDRGDYGWMEWIGHEECESEAEVVLFFERAGAMLALLYALAGTDMHFENIIAHGAHPVPVDLEALMVPARSIDNISFEEAQVAAAEALQHSVMQVGLLPHWISVRHGGIYNFGGLGAVEKEEETAAGSSPHLACLNGQKISSHLYREQIITGFRAMYGLLRTHQADLIAGPLDRFRGLPVRFINRATSLYGRILAKGATAAALESGTRRSIELDVVMKNSLSAPALWQEGALGTALSEIAAMERGDIPFFQGIVDRRDLALPETGGMLRDFFIRDGFSIAEHRLRSLSDEDFAQQLKFIRLSFDLMGGKAAEKNLPASRVSSRAPSFEAEAATLAREICDEAITKGSSASWIAPQLIPGSDGFQIRSLSDSLYDGSIGIMLFLLAAEKNLGEKESGRLARAIFTTFRGSLSKPIFQSMLRQAPLGLGGLSGQIQALLQAADFTGNSDFCETAISLAELITDEKIRDDKELDVVGGVAGAIPAFLRLHALTNDRRWLEKALLGGERLLMRREETASGPRAWKTYGNFLSGYSHGAAGMASALRRLHAACGDERFREAADEAIVYENTLFDPEHQNWRDLRSGGTGFMVSWCHGAPGIALGRMLGSNATLPESDIAIGLQTTIATGVMPLDQCCCGNAGKADILAFAARQFDRSDYTEAARDLMARAIAHAHAQGGYACYGALPRSVRGPGFFQGLSGIGYTLLRLQDPSLPSVLAF